MNIQENQIRSSSTRDITLLSTTATFIFLRGYNTEIENVFTRYKPGNKTKNVNKQW